jgi:dipeptidyl aminopeptidase/acylaminoacyl peptidase
MTSEEMELQYEHGVLPAAVYWPSGPGPHPAVVIAPGGLEQGSVDAYRWAAERLSNAGYAALIATYRTPSPYSDAEDLRCATDWLSSNAKVDSGRIAAWGHSRGGLGAVTSAANDERIRGVVSICAPADLPDYMSRLGTYFPAARDSIAQFLGGLPAEIPEKYASLQLLDFGGRLMKPVLLLHGTADLWVPVDQSVRLAAALKDGGNSGVRLELLPGVGHFLELGTLGYQFDRVIDLTTSWLNEVLG